MHDLETIIAMNSSDKDGTAKKYADAGHKLMRLFIAEGWQPEDLEAFALDNFVDIRECMLQSIRMNRT